MTNRRLVWPIEYIGTYWDGDVWTVISPTTPSDAQAQIARLFGRPKPKRKRKGNRNE